MTRFDVMQVIKDIMDLIVRKRECKRFKTKIIFHGVGSATSLSFFLNGKDLNEVFGKN